MTEWHILIFLVPAVTVPIVLLWGFAGCGSFGADPGPPTPDPPAPPSTLQATASSTSQIDLTWEHPSAGGVNFHVGRQRADGSWDDGHAGVATPLTAKQFSDTGLEEGKFYNYRVKAVLPGAIAIASATSNEHRTRTLKWEPAYDKPLAINGGNFARACLVQRIDKALLKFTGKTQQIRIALRGSTSAPLSIDRVFISQAVPVGGIPTNPTPERWDSNSDLTKVYENLDAGGVPQPLILPASSAPTTLGPIKYSLSAAEDLIIAFDINAAAGAARRREADVETSTCYVNGDAAEAGKADRTSSPAQWPQRPDSNTNAVYLVEKIEALTSE